MLELLFSLLLQLATLQNGGLTPVGDDKAATSKTTTTVKAAKTTTTTPLEPGIGSGGWDDKN
ncbi:hypothetical protein AAE02nite_47350 [Adhaeribacter aerolatus]|uniref:Uncharacterized protein n=1 Tax=Adhaeribacter aerolatus TaxID=670289 RepID=A0A512B559_9BACT|nr:hypothetical protein [Adhaeribacter aerolatus]GEO07071.1 hypothetical protein AAE02nite_47350 [Adhaeribacter aerolatus]